jgi:hypothetical protein
MFLLSHGGGGQVWSVGVRACLIEFKVTEKAGLVALF